jgi:putative acetyltransferase
MKLRFIQQADNQAIAKIIRDTLTEFGANHPGTVYFDSATDTLFEVFQKPKSVYYIAETEEGKIVGGGGIYPTEGLPSDTCELVKMYFRPEARGLGLGKRLLQLCLDEAVKLGYHQIYLETIEQMHAARGLYAHLGFKQIDHAMGNTGHFSCDFFYLKAL